MNQNNLAKIGYWLGFVVLAGISCWATEHSFHLLINWFPVPLVWAFTVAFFVIASYGSKLILDACDFSNFVPHRRRNLWIGIALVASFWLCMSMPTNTHTFFYQHKIGNVVQDDIEHTNKYLAQISSRQNYDSKYDSIDSRVNGLFLELSREFHGVGRSDGRRGDGRYVREKMLEINAVLEKEAAGRQIVPATTFNKFNEEALNNYERQMRHALAFIKDNNYKVSRKEAAKADTTQHQLQLMGDTIKVMVQVGGVHEDVITQTEGVLNTAYSQIKNHQKYVTFEGVTDKDLYTAENLETRTKRMLSVIDVWADFMNGKYPMSFLFYIFLSVLIDLGAFMFFYLATK
jgi:putative lipoprotein